MLMDQPRNQEAAACPSGANEDERRRLGYNAMARLAGPDCKPFAAVSEFLRRHGLNAPQIIAHDYDSGFLLIEDFGDGRFADLILKGHSERPLYESAIDVLAHLHQVVAPENLAVPGAGAVPLLAYDVLALRTEVHLLLEWFYPAATGQSISMEAGQHFSEAWDDALKRIRPDKPVVVLRDFHAENLMWLEHPVGGSRAGLLDFQDALAGSSAYDLVSLTEDARRDVSTELAEEMFRRYVSKRRSVERAFDEEAFRFSAALLAAQRNTKIVGIFARLWKRDGKPRYTQYLPRMWRYLERDLSHPALGSLKSWFDTHIPQSLRGIPGS